MSVKTYIISARMTADCQAKTTIKEMVQENAASFKTLIGPDKKNGMYPLYADEIKDTSQFAYMVKLVDENNTTVPESDAVEILSDPDTAIWFKEVEPNGKILKGTVTLEEKRKVVSGDSKVTMSPELAAVIEEKIAAGMVTREDMDARMVVFRANYVPEPLIIQVVSHYRFYNKAVRKPSTIYVDPYLSQSLKRKQEGIITDGLRVAMMRYGTVCKGEKSVGKNVYLETLAWLLGMPLYLITFSRHKGPGAIYGEKSTDNSASEFLSSQDALEAVEADEEIQKLEAAKETIQETVLTQIMNKDGFADEFVEYITQCVLSNQTAELITEDPEKSFAMKKASETPSYTPYLTAIKKLEDEIGEWRGKKNRLELKKAQAGSVSIIFDQSVLYDWLVDGGLMVLNEMNLAEANFFAEFANQMLDGTGFLVFPGRGEVYINKDCVLFGTQNDGCATCSVTSL